MADPNRGETCRVAASSKALSTLETIRRFRRQSPVLATVAEFGDYSRQCGQAITRDKMHRRNLRGEVRGYAYPHLLEWGYRTPTFGRPYNIQENVWRLGLCPRNWVARHIQRGSGGFGPKGSGEKMHTRFNCAKRTSIYVKVLGLLIVNVTINIHSSLIRPPTQIPVSARYSQGPL